MRNIFKQPVLASKKVFQGKGSVFAFILLIPVIGFLLYLIPIKEIPGDSITFQARLYQFQDYLLIALIATFESLLLVMIFYLFRAQRKQQIAIIGQGNLGLLSGIPAFLFGTKLCPMCLFAIFGFLGSGAVLFLREYHIWLFLASIIILFFSLYSVAKKINGVCTSCRAFKTVVKTVKV